MRIAGISFLIVFNWVLVYTAQSQQSVTISGHVHDSTSREALIGANINAPAHQTGTSTNAYGFFSLSLPISQRDSLQLIISHVGYQTQSVTVSAVSQSQSFFLSPERKQLEEVVIPGKKDIVHRNESGVIRMDMEEVRALPSFTGEADIMKAARLMPGISTGTEGKSSLFIRGGMPDQNLVMLDEVPLYYVSHFGGFISVFNSDAVKDFKLWKGGFPARFGGRLSSVIDIRMKEGDMRSYHGKGSVGLLASKVAYEGPVLKDKASFILSARRRMLPIFRMAETGLQYNFYDVNGKMNYAPDEKNRLYFSFYTGMDKIENVPDNDTGNEYRNRVDWGNTLFSFRWNHVYGPRLFSNFTLAHTRYNYQNYRILKINKDSLSKKTDNEFSSGINDIHAKMDFTYNAASGLTLRFGLQSVYHTFLPNKINYFESRGSQTIKDTIYNRYERKAWENGLYTTGEWEKGWFNAVAGLRLSHYQTGDLSDLALEPRLLTNFILSPTFSVKFSYTQMKQFVHLLSYSGVGVPSDYWMPSTAQAPPETARQVSLSLAKTLLDGKVEASLEAYYKRMNHMIAFKQGASFRNSTQNWEQLTESNGIGTSRGVELLLRKKQGAWQGWVSVTHAKSEREFDNLNSGEPYPFKYDRTWDISAVASYRINKNTKLSATWQYGTGTPISMPLEKYQTQEEDLVYVYSGKNNFRMRDYHRLDIAAHFSKKNHWGRRTISISLMNVYNRQNPYYYFFRRETRSFGPYPNDPDMKYLDLKLYQQSLIPFFPSISYRFEF